MTLPGDSHHDDDKKSEAGKALAPASSSPVNPFVAAAAAEGTAGAAASRPLLSRMLDYSAHAAIIVGLIGFAWTIGDHVVDRPSAKDAAATGAAAPLAAAALPQPTEEMAQLRLSNQKLHDEIKALKASVDTLRTAVRHDTTPEQVRMLSAGLDAMKGSLSSTSAAIAQMNGKIDKLQPGKIQQLAERVGRLEHQSLDPAATGSIAKADPIKPDSTPKPPVKPASLGKTDDKSEDPSDDKPSVIAGWVVRDVYQGVALIEGKRGSMEVVPGVTIPGAGVVKSIERHGSGWIVTTTKGQLASALPATAQRTEYRHSPYQGPYGYQRGYMPYRYGY